MANDCKWPTDPAETFFGLFAHSGASQSEAPNWLVPQGKRQPAKSCPISRLSVANRGMSLTPFFPEVSWPR